MTDRPILFSAPMIKALLAGTKSQTRRVVTPSRSTIGSLPASAWDDLDFGAPGVFVDGKGDASIFQPIAGCQYLHVPHRAAVGELMHGTRHRVYSRVEPGDVLWVRETWCTTIEFDHLSTAQLPDDAPIRYLPTSNDPPQWGRHRQSIFMQRRFSRITLPLLSVRCERLQDISEADAIAEGARCSRCHGTGIDPALSEWCSECGGASQSMTARDDYRALWIEINGAESWDASPWVWVYGFEAILASAVVDP